MTWTEYAVGLLFAMPAWTIVLTIAAFIAAKGNIGLAVFVWLFLAFCIPPKWKG